MLVHACMNECMYAICGVSEFESWSSTRPNFLICIRIEFSNHASDHARQVVRYSHLVINTLTYIHIVYIYIYIYAYVYVYIRLMCKSQCMRGFMHTGTRRKKSTFSISITMETQQLDKHCLKLALI